MQEANNKVEEVEEKMRNLKEELEMIRYKKNVFCSASCYRLIASICNCCFTSINNVKIFDGFFRNENITLQSKLDYWELRAKYSAEKLYSFKKENEHQVINYLLQEISKLK
jgi:hypothetical protein